MFSDTNHCTFKFLASISAIHYMKRQVEFFEMEGWSMELFVKLQLSFLKELCLFSPVFKYLHFHHRTNLNHGFQHLIHHPNAS